MFINNKGLTYIRNERLLLKKPQNILFRKDTKIYILKIQHSRMHFTMVAI